MIDLDRDDGPTNASDEPRGGAGIEPPRHALETIGARENAGSHTMAFIIKRGQIEILSLGQTSSWIDVLLAVPTLHSFDTANRRSSSEMTQKAVSQSTLVGDGRTNLQTVSGIALPLQRLSVA